MQNFVDREDFYRHTKPKDRERTKKRLTQLQDMGMTLVGIAQFGIKGVFSGLYIENVWNYSNKEWDSYINWVESLKEKHK